MPGVYTNNIVNGQSNVSYNPVGTYSPVVTPTEAAGIEQAGTVGQTQTPATVTPPATVISAANLAPQTTPVYPNPTTTATTQANTALGANLAAANTAVTPQTVTAPTTTATPQQSVLNQLLGIEQQYSNEGADTAAAQSQYNVAGLTTAQQNATNAYNAKEQYYNDQIKQLQTSNPLGKSQDAIDEQVQNLSRQRDDDLADLAITKSAADGDLTTATNLANAAVQAKYAPLKDEISTLQTWYSLAGNDLTESEQLEAQQNISQQNAKYEQGIAEGTADYEEQIKQNDPLNQAQVASERADASYKQAQANLLAGSSSGTTNGNTTISTDASGNMVAQPTNSTDYKNGVPITSTGAANSSNTYDQQAYALATGLAAPSQYVSARQATTPAGKALLDRTNQIAMAITGQPFNAASSEAAFKFRNSSQYQKLTANIPTAIETIAQAANAAQSLGLTNLGTFNRLKITGLANGVWPGGTPQEQADAKSLQSLLSLNQDDLGLILGSGTGSDFKDKLAGLIFDPTGSPLSTSQLTSSLVNKITDKLGTYYTGAGIQNGKTLANQTAQQIINDALGSNAVDTSSVTSGSSIKPVSGTTSSGLSYTVTY